MGSWIRRIGPIKKLVNTPITPMKYKGNVGQKLVPVRFNTTAMMIANMLNQNRYLIKKL